MSLTAALFSHTMENTLRRTKIVATIGPASNSTVVLRQMVQAGMNVARLNFSHGSYEDHAATIANIRAVARELDTPITLLQDLQGPKIRVGRLPEGKRTLNVGEIISLVPQAEYREQADFVPIDYPDAAEEAKPGMQVLLDDGLLELEVVEIVGTALRCKVVEGGVLKDRKGVNFPSLNLRLPSMTEKDKQDLEFGLAQDVDWVSLSFVRSGEDIRALKTLLAEKGKPKPVIAKIEKPQAIEHLEEILDEATGIMVARGDLGVEMKPEMVPMLQKRIIEMCNRRGMPVITATQMLDSMIREPRPTRAEASDVANAIIDGTDAVMLSGESAVGAFPVRGGGDAGSDCARSGVAYRVQELSAGCAEQEHPRARGGGQRAGAGVEAALHRGADSDGGDGAMPGGGTAGVVGRFDHEQCECVSLPESGVGDSAVAGGEDGGIV